MLTIDANVWVAAFDPADVFHAVSVAVLSRAAHQGLRLYAPDFAIVEVACAVSRRRRDTAAGLAAAAKLQAHPLLTLIPLDALLLAEALRIGTSCFLRGADALYAATAAITRSTLLSWDDELVKRANGVTPSGWLASTP